MPPTPHINISLNFKPTASDNGTTHINIGLNSKSTPSDTGTPHINIGLNSDRTPSDRGTPHISTGLNSEPTPSENESSSFNIRSTVLENVRGFCYLYHCIFLFPHSMTYSYITSTTFDNVG